MISSSACRCKPFKKASITILSLSALDKSTLCRNDHNPKISQTSRQRSASS